MLSFDRLKSTLLPFLIVAVVLVSGCVNQTADEGVVPTGMEGIVVTFFQGAPPSVLGEGETFDAGVTIENKGDHEVVVGDAEIYLRGVNPTNFGYGGVGQIPANQQVLSNLVGAQLLDNQLIGGQDALTWPDLCYRVDLNTDQVVDFIAQSCYKYKSKARFDGCFNENAYRQTTGTELCSVLGDKLISNSRAPVQITSVSESPAGEGKFRFIVKVGNLGTGQVYTEDLGTACVDAAIRELNVVHIDGIKIGATSLDLGDTATVTSATWLGTQKPYFKLVNGEGQFMFTYAPSFTAVPIYIDPVEITLSYGYSDQVITSTQISSIPGVNPQSVC